MSREEINSRRLAPSTRIALTLVGLLLLVYLVDYGMLRRKMANPNQTLAYGTITSFYGTGTKGGRMEIFTDQPQTETCVHSLFPHAGYRACWYVSKSGVQTF
ncbi:MAG TPA: hypothetical protein VGD60_13935 [Candidatus Acidoferrales bacterium]